MDDAAAVVDLVRSLTMRRAPDADHAGGPACPALRSVDSAAKGIGRMPVVYPVELGGVYETIRGMQQ